MSNHYSPSYSFRAAEEECLIVESSEIEKLERACLRSKDASTASGGEGKRNPRRADRKENVGDSKSHMRQEKKSFAQKVQSSIVRIGQRLYEMGRQIGRGGQADVFLVCM